VAEMTAKTFESNRCDVLVIGLGPVGATLTGLLRTHGLAVIAIDREADIYPLPRAGSFDGEAMRVFQMIGVAEALRPSCRVLEGYRFVSDTRQTLLEFMIPGGVGPYGWDATYAFHQPEVERALRSRLAALGADIRLSTRLVGFTENANGVTAHVERAGHAGTITARYIIGCDGANSRVRETMGAGVFDYGFSECWLVVDTIIADAHDLPQIPVQFCDPAQPTTLARMTGARYRWEFMLKPGDDPETFASDATLARLLAPWNEADRIKIERRALYRFRGLLANQWRAGRALLAGDAAHLMPPFLGQGMCSGIRDACNLAWKLAAVIHGEASAALLDTYQKERESHVRGIIERSIELGRMICILDPQMAAQRDAGMLAMRAAGRTPDMVPLPPLSGGCLMGGRDCGELFIQPVIAGKRLDDELGPGAWLIALKAATHPLGRIRQFRIDSDSVGAFGEPLKKWLHDRATAAVLVRPDRYIFGTGDPDDLVCAWHDQLHAAPGSINRRWR
jgi:3-(3-hydroxy-phenyl)propionate hydroxylase